MAYVGRQGRSTPSSVCFRCARFLLGACLLFVVSMPLVVKGGSSASDDAVLKRFATEYKVAAWLNSQAQNASAPWPYLTCDSTGRVTGIQLNAAGLAGSLPNYLQQLENLELLQLATGRLQGTLPDDWQQAFPKLQQLDLSANNFSGGVPAAWTGPGSFPSLTALNLKGAFIKNATMSLPFSSGQSGMANLTSLNLALCNLTGSLTSSWGQGFSNLSTLVLSNNMLTGPLPDTWGSTSGTSQLRQLMLDSNQITGHVNPAWGAAGSFKQLQWLSLANNLLTGTLPTEWGTTNSLPALQTLQLNDLNLTGTLPASWGQSTGLSNLSTVFLQNNMLSGGIPVSWANNRSSLAKYLQPGNPRMCEPIRARLAGVRTFGTAAPAVSCLDMGCNQESDILDALAVGSTQGCVVTINADESIQTTSGCQPGTIQLNASSGNLSAQYVIANQPALTIQGSFFTSLASLEVVGPVTTATVVNSSVSASGDDVPIETSPGSLLESATPDTPAANQSTPMVNQSAPLIISNTTVHIVDSVFDSNQRFDFGGMIVMNGAAVTVSNTSFRNLQGRVAGAALITYGSLVMINQGSSFTGNSGTCLAGAVLVKSDSALYLDDSTFANNHANGDRGGGAVLLYDNSTLHAVNTVFTQNQATAANLYGVDAVAGGTPSDLAIPTQWCGAVGGVAGIDSLYGINDLASNHLLSSGSGTDPTLGQGGGAIYAASFALLNLTSTTFTNNSASRVNITNFWQGRGAGGAISINSDALVNPTCGPGIVSITDCTFSGNQANSGGALQLVGGGHSAVCYNSQLTNQSYGSYSTSYLDSLPYASYTFCDEAPKPYCTISNSRFHDNAALLGGGSISVLQSYSVQLNNLTFTNSTTPYVGGAVAVANGSAVTSSNCTYTACTAAAGGAMYVASPSESYISSAVLPQFKSTFIYATDVYRIGRLMGSAVTLMQNTFRGNKATGAGAALHMSGDGHLVSQGNTFTAHQAGTQGGAMYLNNVCEQQSLQDTFADNSAQQGGAVAILSPALLSGRYVVSVTSTAGTSSLVRLPCSLQSALVNAAFTDNQATVSGGAVYVASTPKGDCRALLDSSQLVRNYAANGGAFYAGSTPCFVVQSSNFSGNSATNGGGMAVHAATNASLSTVTAVGNSATFGGAVFVDRTVLLQVSQSNMSRNLGSNGAGIAVQQVTSVTMYNVSIADNTAAQHGGALYSIQPTISLQDRAALNAAHNEFQIGDLFLTLVNMSRNIANQGGCMYVTGNGANITVVNSYFDSCIAHDVAGGLMCNNCPQVFMSQVAFLANLAQASAGGMRCSNCEAVILETVQFDNNSAIHGGAVDINASTPTPVIIVGSDFMSNTARITSDDLGTNTSIVLAGNGGAIRCIGGNLFLFDDTFEDNIATNGAAVYAEQGCGEADDYNSGYCSLTEPGSNSTAAAAAATTQLAGASTAVSAALRYDDLLNILPNCSKVALTQTQFAGNKAIGGGGGAIFWDGPVADLVVSCSDTEAAVDLDNVNSTASCEDWEGNNSTLGFGGNLASAAAAINVSASNVAAIEGFASGNVLPTLRFDVIDHFGNVVSGGVSAAEMLISATSSNAILGGQQLAQAQDGVVTFDGLIITANSTMNTTRDAGLDYDITFSAASVTGITPWTIGVNIRGCQAGEQYDNNICRECQEQTYSFHPGDNKGQCQTCPDTAHCPGGPIFVPDDGYWHSSFDTDTAQRCPNTFACSYSTLTSASLATSADSKRSAFLIACQTAYYNGSTMANVILDTSGNLSDITCTDNTAYQDAECQKGYTGVLCTNCADGYGNSRTFHCTECMHSVPTNTFLIFLGYFASFCYVAWLVRGCLASAAQVGKAEGDHFEQFSDMMKVVTTYLQTNGIVAGLNINWPNSLRSIQNLFNVVQSSMVNTVSMDCSLQYWDTPVLSQAGFEALLALLIPIGMLAIFCLGWTCRWAWLRKYGELTDITGRPISRASSQSSLAPSHERKDMLRSNTRDTDLSGSDSDEDDEADPGLSHSPSAKGQSKRFIRTGSSRSEDGSPRTTWEDQDDDLIPAGQSKSEDGSPTQDWLATDDALAEADAARYAKSQEALTSPATVSPPRAQHSALCMSKLAAAAAHGGLLSAQSSGDLGSAYRTDSADSQSPLLSRLLGNTSLTEAELAEEMGTAFSASALQPSAAQQDPLCQSGADKHAGISHPLQASMLSSPSQQIESLQIGGFMHDRSGDDMQGSFQGSPPRQIPTAPVLAAIHTSSSHPLQQEGLSSAETSPSSSLGSSPRQKKHGSTRFALNESESGGSLGSSAKTTRIGQSALKRGNTMGSSLSSAKSTKRVQLAAPEKASEQLQTTDVALEIQESSWNEEEDHSWPGPASLHKPQAKLMPSKSSLKASTVSGSMKSAASKSRFHRDSAQGGSLRFSLAPQRQPGVGVLHEDSMNSDHSTLSASFKSFRSIPSRLSQFGTSQSLRWSVTTVRSDEFWAYCKRRFLTTAMVLAYFMYPDMSENIANIFSCYPVQIGTYSNGTTGSVTQYYWTQDTTELCFKGNHFWVALLLGVPGVLLVCLGVPIWFAGVLYRKRDNLMDISLHRTYGFLYQGYKDKYYWWESAILLRNLLLVAVVYLGTAFGVYIQAHIVLLIMVASLVLHAYTRPFKEDIIDTMELVSIGSIALVMYVSLYFLDTDQGLTTRNQWVLGFVLLVIIAGTVLWFLYCVFRRRHVLIALLKSTSVKATRGIQQIKTLVKSERLRSMVTRSTQRTVSSAAPSEA